MTAGAILLVDDEREFTDTLEKLLARRGERVLVASDGAQGLRAVTEHDVDVVLLDLKMPGLSGMDTLRELKRVDPRIEVIILTGHLLKSSEQEGLSFGAFAYLTKPCTVSELVETIAAARARRSRASAPPSKPA